MKPAVLLLMLFASSFVSAATTNIADDCEQWREIRKQSSEQPMLYWIQGFVAAYNKYEYSGKDPKGIMGKAEGKDIATWMDGYCNENSNSNPQEAIESLMEEREPPKKACPVRRSGGRPCPRAKKEEIPEINNESNKGIQ